MAQNLIHMINNFEAKNQPTKKGAIEMAPP